MIPPAPCLAGHLLFAAAVGLTPAMLLAQADGQATFGTTVVVPGGLTGRIYFLRPNTWVLPNFEKLEPAGTIYTKVLNIPPRDFREGFPGITDRVEWFAIDFTGRFYIDKPGDYEFKVESDDGSKLYIDQKLLIDNDGDHPSLAKSAAVSLSGGIHSIRLSYFQGPGYGIALMLSVSGPGDRRLRPFNTDNFKPPTNPDNWKYGSPAEWKESPDPHLLRRSPKDESVSVPVEILSHDKAVRGLKRSDFLIRDNQEPMDIAGADFASRPLDIVLLIESSAGMRPLVDGIVDAARRAQPRLEGRDHVAVVVFGGTQLLTIGFCARPDRVLNAIRQNTRVEDPAVSNSAAQLNSAIVAASNYIRQNARPEAVHAIVILTLNDGRKQLTDDAARNVLWRSDVTLSGLISKIGPVTKREAPDAADVRPLIAATGGDMLEMDRKNIPLGEIFQRLRERYVVTYRLPEGRSKTIHNLTVDLTPAAKTRLQDWKIRVRGGYVTGE